MDNPSTDKRISELRKEIIQLETILVGKDKDLPENTPFLSALSLRKEELRSLLMQDSPLPETPEIDPFGPDEPEPVQEKAGSPKAIFLLYKQNDPDILAKLENQEYRDHPTLHPMQEQYNKKRKEKTLQNAMQSLDNEILDLRRRQDDILREFMVLQSIDYPPHTEVQDNVTHRTLIINIRAYESFASFLSSMDEYYPRIMRMAYDKSLSIHFVKKGKVSVRKS